MKQWLARTAERIDALGVRERVAIFFALALALVVIANAIAIGPLRAKQERLAVQIGQAQKDLATLQAQLQALVKGAQFDPDAANRERRVQLREELRALNLRIADQQRRFTPPERMRRLLGELLERHRGLVLVDMQTLPVAAVSRFATGVPSTAMYRHGLELTVRGTYAELYDYLRSLETLPNQLYWARAELAVATHPLITLKITVHTVSFDRAWLAV
jgi:MSHA biogenesis protein MshJ